MRLGASCCFISRPWVDQPAFQGPHLAYCPVTSASFLPALLSSSLPSKGPSPAPLQALSRPELSGWDVACSHWHRPDLRHGFGGLHSRVKWAPGPCPYGISPCRPSPASEEPRVPWFHWCDWDPQGVTLGLSSHPSPKLSGETCPGTRPVTGWRRKEAPGPSGRSGVTWGGAFPSSDSPLLAWWRCSFAPGDDPGPLMGQKGTPAAGVVPHVCLCKPHVMAGGPLQGVTSLKCSQDSRAARA